MDNRETLLEDALQLFSTRGYDAVGIQEIVDKAGVTKPTLYHYFGSKYGLLEGVLERDFNGLIDQVVDAADYNHDIVLNLTQLARVYFHFAVTHPVFYRLQLSMHFSAPDSEPKQAVAPFQMRQHAILEELFTKAAGDHGNMRSRQGIYAATYLGMINTYIGLALDGHIHLGEDVIYRAVHQFMHGIFS
jgi:AcrR family transcriptional regulator